MINDIINLTEKEAYEIFPKKKCDLSKLQTTNVGKFSVSKRAAAYELTKMIHKYFKSYDINITDCTANVGSDSLMLAKYFKHVNAIEYDKTNFAVLQNNLGVYGYENLDLINGDSTKELNNTTQDVIYVDPPWGGIDYKKT